MGATVEATSHRYIHRKEDYLKRLRRIEGQARGLQRMAMTKALQSVALGPARGGVAGMSTRSS